MSEDGRVVDDCEIVTKFLLDTYRLVPTRHNVRAAFFAGITATVHPPDEPEADSITLISGSTAELYIKPMLPCIGDVDIMCHSSADLAIPRGYPAPTELPAEFHRRVNVLEIIDSEYPGYVYLMRRHILTATNDDGLYEQVPKDAVLCGYMSFARKLNDTVYHGPARTTRWDTYSLSSDQVMCVRCLCWPPQAADWPTRPRSYGWPDPATVDRVVSNGCDTVQVPYRLCKQEWDRKHQWRLSFSRAEIVLLNSWMPIQQIVYHMLRVFKNGELTDNSDTTETKVISNYHFKTLMLWACEMKPRNWWTSEMNTVRICVELLHTLAVWLTDSRCSHYFITNCNLINTEVNVKITICQLNSVTESCLSRWFIYNYLWKCAQLCPDNVSRLFDDVSTSVKLKTAAAAVVDCRRNTELDDVLTVHYYAEYIIAECVSIWCQTVHSCAHFMNESTVNLRILDYSTGIAFSHFVLKFFNCDYDLLSMDVLSAVCGQLIGRRRCSNQPGSVMLLSQAAKLMKDAVYNSRSAVQLIEIELSKAYLYRALRCKDSDNDSIYCLANVYLAVLYYTTGQCQTAMDHCTLVTRSQDHSQCRSHVVQGELLPRIDDDIDNALGLAVFYRYVRAAALYQSHQAQHVRALTTDLFAFYLLIRFLSAKTCRHFPEMLLTDDVHCHRKYINDKLELFVSDLLLLKYVNLSTKLLCNNKTLIYQRQPSTMSSAELDTSELVELLQQSAIEHLTTYRQFLAREFCSVATIVTTDFEAMYAYKRGDYQLCLQLSTQNLRTLWHVIRTGCVFLFPEFLQLLDDDIVSVTALTLIIDPKCRLDRRCVRITQLTLSLYLMTQCQLKLRHSATQLAQTLDYIGLVQRRHAADRTLDHLTLKLAGRKVVLFLKMTLSARW